MTVDKITACHIRTKALNSLRVVDVIYLLTYAVLRSTGGGILRKTLFFRAPPPVDLRSYRLPDGSAAKEKKKKFGRLEHMIIMFNFGSFGHEKPFTEVFSVLRDPFRHGEEE